MIYRKIEQIFTDEEQKLLDWFEEDEDYTVLNTEIVEKLVAEDIEEESRVNYWQVIVKWVYSWFS